LSQKKKKHDISFSHPVYTSTSTIYRQRKAHLSGDPDDTMDRDEGVGN
jgi:hypothetical protein